MATVVHVVMFRFRPEITQEHKDMFQRELKKLKNLSCVKDNRLLVGGPSVTDPIARSQGFHYCLVSYHHNLKALEEYQASKEHHDVTSRLMWPFIDDVCRFDFEVSPEDEYMVGTSLRGIGEDSQANSESGGSEDSGSTYETVTEQGI
ncbi:hypothetical protein AYL99_09295 [Fonsecaea erecta]|uniref:Stress-response A/B barrel domain-containing protein n=1 Tax=Fonsecaea erecta TaxID=1367422 RepID=A0A178Z9H9_9EURO|nr:hypothetical protein AYL99_09295 [Fonsecaea erecta]OAP56116.1 hypothetical protein AYL99_09295 [Fonsecaea erecta]